MKLTLAGTPGSGKSTIRAMLAEHYHLEVKGTGDFMRKMAKQKGYNDITDFLVEYVTKHPEVDNQIDDEQRNYGQQNDDFVLDAHLGFHFVPDSIKIELKCSLNESAKRILADKLRTTEASTTLAQSMAASKKRRDTMRENFLKLYNVDIDRSANFDLSVDTSMLTPEQVFEKLVEFIDSYQVK